MNFQRAVSAFFASAVLIVAGCGGGGGGGGADTGAGAVPQAWAGTLSGTSVPGQCSLGGDKGEFAESYTFSIVVGSSLGSLFAQSNGSTVTGTGSYSGSESVSRQSPFPGICRLDATTVTDAPLTVSAFWLAGAQGSTPTLNFRSSDTLIHDRLNGADVPVSSLLLSAASATATSITGTWITAGSGSASGNFASGTFTLQLVAAGGGGVGTPTGVSATGGNGQATVVWNTVTNATGYVIYASTSPAVSKTNFVFRIPGATSPAVVPSLANGQTWYFVVTAVSGNSEGTESPTASATTGGVSASSVRAGESHSCALVTGGKVRCWGKNTSGQLGDGTTGNRNAPVEVAGLSGVTAIAVGVAHSCALMAGGTVKCWGDNFEGQIGDGTAGDILTPIVRKTPVDVVGLTGATAVTAGASSTCALINDGTVKCWGHMIDAAGTVSIKQLTPLAVLGFSAVSAVSAGQDSVCGLIGIASVSCWNYGKSTGATTVSGLVTGSAINVTAIAVGGLHACAHGDTNVLANGVPVRYVRCWGSNSVGQLGDGSTTSAATPVSSGVGPTVTGVAAGHLHTCSTLQGGTAKCWGLNEAMQLGDETAINRPSPVDVVGLAGAAAIAAGGDHTCALISGGTVKCWGANVTGQLGDGTNAVRTGPVSVAGFQ